MTKAIIHKILVADGNEILGGSIARHLCRHGFDVCRACNVDQAKSTILAAVKTDQAFDLVIADLPLPNRTGVAFINWLHAHHSEVAVLVISGFGNAELLNTLLRPNRDSFRKIPVLPTEIEAAIFSVGQKKRERLGLAATRQEPSATLFFNG